MIVLDSFGIGAMPDAAEFGDETANTLQSLANTGLLRVPNMTAMGLGNIDGVNCLQKVSTPLATVARARELSKGKDTTIGHWEIAGIVSPTPMPTYPEGFPKEILDKFEELTGRGTLCNKPYSGTDVIRDYGDEHVKTGKLIVYTSADSVFQVAAHEDIVPLDELYDICKKARKLMQGEHGVGRIIARPFIGTAQNYKRTANRKDFSLEPPAETYLDMLKSRGKDVIGVGKIGDIFTMKGITETHPTHGNDEGMEMTMKLAERDFNGLCFVNLVDFDMLYGHRQDAEGYTKAINKFDEWLGGFIEQMKDDDALIITADHGCDPSDQSTDHTREHVPVLIYGKRVAPQNLGTVEGFNNIGKSAYDMLMEE